VAKVNGEIITKAAYDTQLADSIDSYKTQGVDVTDATKLSQIKTQVLDNLIADKLISQGVAASGIKTTAEEVEKQYQVILTQVGGADALKAELVKNNLTEAQLRENISKQLAAQTYLLQNIDTKSITVSDAEIAQFYADYSKAQKAKDAKTVVPALKDLSDQIKQKLISDKQQTLVVNFVASLRAKAKVETTIQ
jgi:threonine dehydratase